ncbi:MAG: TetM/TetW/TetO/TetS family tetracycline resistance ribosomal protection protein [Oscillospiraceae bacterium]|nr:TetM/TetW/TetO/TetS family tetracycline resistance ribosomal protection protein [Oscillospiraceae bacterium]
MKKLVCGLVAHVDAGKTTLSEALLYASGAIRRLGRVDHGDAYLDNNAMERERGITIFSKMARLSFGETELTLLDTPGHADFSGETERVFSVLDMAVLVLSGTDGVQGHTRTIWELLKKYRVPVFVFVNKTDLAGFDRSMVMTSLRSLDDGFVALNGGWAEAVAEKSEGALEEYLATGAVSDYNLRLAIENREVFPVLFGSALKSEGVQELLTAIDRCAPTPSRSSNLGARVFKIMRDKMGARMTFMKLTGGEIRVKDILGGEKIDQIRLYSGEKYTLADSAEAGDVVAVTGLSSSFIGEGFGVEDNAEEPYLEPVMSFDAILPEGVSASTALPKFRILEEEDPLLRVSYSEETGRISLRLMGKVQTEVIARSLRDRFGLDVGFGEGGIIYRETVKNTVEGVGHYEPLRHYAEAHIIISPLPRGSGIEIGSIVPEDELDRSWQRLILTHLAEKQHLGVLTGSPITDVRLTLAAGRAHLKHTEGGDFREATYRAVREGLMEAESVLLEPWYDFTLTLPVQNMGRAMTDLDMFGGEYSAPENAGDNCVLTGSAPVSALSGYAAAVTEYTRGLGRLSLAYGGYRECKSAEKVIEAIGYDPERDMANPAGSVFCAHGAGYLVPWNEVKAHMHLESALREEREPEKAPEIRKSFAPAGDKELMSIFERTYGEVRRRDFVPKEERRKYEPRTSLDDRRVEIKTRFTGAEYLLVDGYNVIFAWEELKKVSAESLDAARKMLMDTLANFRGVKKNEIILVFDAYKVKDGVEKVETYNGISVVYTKEAETADTYIERTAHKLSKTHKVYVATSDGPEQMIILGSGALRITALELKGEIELAKNDIADFIRRNNLANRTRPMEDAFRNAQPKDE